MVTLTGFWQANNTKKDASLLWEAFCNRSAKMVIKTTFINEYKNDSMRRSSLPDTPKYGTFESPKYPFMFPLLSLDISYPLKHPILPPIYKIWEGKYKQEYKHIKDY